jgi:hypothetical protein
MLIIWLPQAIDNNLSATRAGLSAVRLKCATKAGKIKESSKVLGRGRLFRLLPKIIGQSDSLWFDRGVNETKASSTVEQSGGRR